MLLVSGTALAKSPSREAVLKAVQLAKKHQVKVVFELDYRPYTWTSAEETSVYYTLVAEQSDIVIGTRFASCTAFSTASREGLLASAVPDTRSIFDFAI